MSAPREQAARSTNGLDERGQEALLARMAHNLTVSAREAYATSATGGPEPLRRYNEIQHLLTARMSSLLKGSDQPDANTTLFEAIDEVAGRDAIGQRIRECVDWAWDFALKQEGLSS